MFIENFMRQTLQSFPMVWKWNPHLLELHVIKLKKYQKVNTDAKIIEIAKSNSTDASYNEVIQK